MSSLLRMPATRPATIGAVLMLACIGVACMFAGTAKASYYKMVLCAANNGSNGFATATNTTSAQNPGGIFSFENYCGPAPYPAGNNAFLRIVESQAAGNAGYGAFGQMSWTAPGSIDIAAAGGYTREPNAFNAGWRGRFWLEGYDGSTNNELVQGSGVENGSCSGVCWATTSTFASHLWPFGGYGRYRRFVFELTCYREAGCDRTNFNAVDANTMVLTLNDTSPSQIALTNTGAGMLAGNWVRGTQDVDWNVSDQGSGMRFERLRVDGGERYAIDWRANCDLGSWGDSGEFARTFQPCPAGGPWSRGYSLDTATLADGAHTVSVCSQDYGQAIGLTGSGSESCDQRTIHVDNTPPPAPGGLTIESKNPARYLDHFGARWTLPSDPGSPIAKVHYDIVSAAGSLVSPTQTVSATNPTALEDIAGPPAAGDYRLRVWLEDSVGLIGPVASVPIPHDTTPPAAPQELSVTSPETSRSDQGFDVRWRNIADNGAPIDVAHYQVIDAAGNVIGGTKDLAGASPAAIGELDAPKRAGNYTLKVWLSDAEGNVGAPAEAPLSYDCLRSDVGGGRTLNAGLSDQGVAVAALRQGQGTQVEGTVRGAGGPLAGAAVCVFDRVVTDPSRDFVGIAMTDSDGHYRFPVPAGPSREVIASYRGDHRQIEAAATVLTRIEPTLALRKATVHNKHQAVFYGDIPGPHNDNVTVVLQVRSGKGWRAFRRYRTREGGHFVVPYRFTQTHRPTTYEMRAQVRKTVGLPYEPGNSRTIKLRVLP